MHVSIAPRLDGVHEITPFPYQEEPIRVLAHALESGSSALDASDTGVGKTIHALMACKLAGKRIGVICPKSVIPAWNELAARCRVGVCFVENVEKLKTGRSRVLTREDKNWVWEIPADVVLIFDEVHRFSASNSQNAKILACAPRAVLMLSATAATDPTKMRAIGHQLRLTNWRDWWRWCSANGCRQGYWGGIEFHGGPEYLDRIHRQIFKTGRGVRVRIADLGPDYPLFRLETVAVPVENQRAIDAAYLDELTALEAHSDPLVATIRARQISEHLKLPAVIEMVEDLVAEGNSVVIFVNFRDSLDRLTDALSTADHGVSCIHGDQDAEEREINVQLFQRNISRILVSMIQAGGIALSMGDLDGLHPRVSLVFPGWSAVDFLQAIRRIHRANSKSPSLTKAVFADDTIEVRVRRKVELKKGRIETLNDGDLTISPVPVLAEPSDPAKAYDCPCGEAQSSNGTLPVFAQESGRLRRGETNL